LALGASRAEASPLLEALGGFGDSGGQQARHAATGPSAAYFNPALLPDAPAGLTLGVGVLGLRLAVTLEGRGDGRYDVPAGLENASHADGTRFDHYGIATRTLQLGRASTPGQSATAARPRQAAGSGVQTQSYEAVGLVVHALQDRIAVGLYGLIPNGEFMQLRSFYADEREQFSSNSLHPELYGDRLSAPSFAFGLGWRLHDRFSIGAGTGVSLRASSVAPAYVPDAARLDSLVLNVDVGVEASLAPHAGFEWRPHDRWRITGTVHASRSLDVRANVQYLLATGVEQTSSLRLVYDWMPWQAGLGTSWDVVQRSDSTLTLAASGVYGRWSQYVDRHGERPAPELGWYDTVTGALGARLTMGAWRFGLDLRYQPTGVPLQRGRSSYVDNDRIGASHTLAVAVPIGDSRLELGLQLQGSWMLSRFASKRATPTFPDGVNRTPALVKDEVPDDAQLGLRPAEGAAGLHQQPRFPRLLQRGLARGRRAVCGGDAMTLRSWCSSLLIVACRLGGPEGDPSALTDAPGTPLEAPTNADVTGVNGAPASEPPSDSVEVDRIDEDGRPDDIQTGSASADASAPPPSESCAPPPGLLCDPVANTGCLPLMQCIADPSGGVETAHCVFAGVPLGTACTRDALSTTCPPGQACILGQCREYCYCDADCEAGECGNQATFGLCTP
jgi:hypothetical protein